MRNEIGDLFLRTRISLGLTLPQLARRAGYRNLNKGARRLESLERHGVAVRDLIERAAAALDLDPQQVAETMARDDAARRADFAAWLEVPQPMVLIYMAVIALPYALPEGLSEEQAIAFTIDLQKRMRFRMCLVLNRRRSFWVSSDGQTYFTETTPDRPNFPYNTIG